MTAILRSAQDWIAGLLAVLIVVYLTYTLLRPEKF